MKISVDEYFNFYYTTNKETMMTIFAIQTSGKYTGHEWLGLAYVASNIKDDDTVVMFDNEFRGELTGDEFINNIDKYRHYAHGGSTIIPFIEWYMDRQENKDHEDIVFISNGQFNEFWEFGKFDQWMIENMVTIGKYSWFNPLLA